MTQTSGSILLLCAAALATGGAHAEVPAGERQALVALYDSTDGAHWIRRTNWLEGDPCDNRWYSITCSPGRIHVAGIYLGNNNLSGRLPALGALAYLETFAVNSNRLTGPVPALSGLVKLQTFEVSYNRLSGNMPPLAGLTELRFFNVAENRLTGTIPVLKDLHKLSRFIVGGNRLTGSIAAAPDQDVLSAGSSSLCPNELTPAETPPSAKDLAWNAATGSTPWSVACMAASFVATTPAPSWGRSQSQP
jgi:hypothetical protein